MRPLFLSLASGWIGKFILMSHVQTHKTLICGTVAQLCSVVLESVEPLQLKKSNETLGRDSRLANCSV